MADYLTIEDAVLGHPLKTLGKRHRGMTGTQPGSGARSGGVERMLGSGSARRNRAFAGNARRLPQAMVKRVAAGGCRGRLS